MAFYSPLRYPGGKGKISDFFYATIEANNLNNGVYVEPYAGGSSIALSLLINGYVSEIIINDIDRSIYAFWKSVLEYNDELCRLITKTRVNLSTWNKCKEVQKSKTKASILDLGFSTFFLNRTNRSGIINGGVIGGKEQDGDWKIDARYNKQALISRIKLIREYRKHIKLYNKDAHDFVKQIIPSFDSKTLCYFDPPYFEKGKALYVNYYENKDHQKIADAISSIRNTKWIVSYDNKNEIKNMYNQFRSNEYNLRYSAAETRSGSEIMFFSDDLEVSKDMIVSLHNKETNSVKNNNTRRALWRG